MTIVSMNAEKKVGMPRGEGQQRIYKCWYKGNPLFC